MRRSLDHFVFHFVEGPDLSAVMDFYYSLTKAPYD